MFLQAIDEKTKKFFRFSSRDEEETKIFLLPPLER
jgi:hypothetical protein